METIWTTGGAYQQVLVEREADLEEIIKRVQSELFGPGRVYLDVKRRIGSQPGPRNIPDGYLLDLTGDKPRLFVVEVELASHDPLRHIAVQILQFSLSFESEPRVVKKILDEALQSQSVGMTLAESYAVTHGFGISMSCSNTWCLRVPLRHSLSWTNCPKTSK